MSDGSGIRVAGWVAASYAVVVLTAGILTWTDPGSAEGDYIPLLLLVDLPLGWMVPELPFTDLSPRGWIIGPTLGGLVQAAALWILIRTISHLGKRGRRIIKARQKR
ncbi:hypothetical protein [Spirillospora albida]|uniref:hypothetical protein n=1 Tax=Spirillospora albida TaxID=58123 RepID=UPI0012FBE28D|nr:hypothetical protein [Spirillospora albida]